MFDTPVLSIQYKRCLGHMDHTLAKFTYEAQRHNQEESKGEEAAGAETGKVEWQGEVLDFTPGSMGKVVEEKRMSIGG
jgi:hypothetical protein